MHTRAERGLAHGRDAGQPPGAAAVAPRRRRLALYEPLIRKWLGRHPALAAEIDDLTQDILAVLVRKVPEFRHQRAGSFRRWLRVVTANRVKEFWRARAARPAAGGDEVEGLLAQLEDPHGELSRRGTRSTTATLPAACWS
jgi:RNA polymerase sigma-70 factor (ECF subfamily)